MAKLTDLWVNIGARTDKLDQGLTQAKTKLKGFENTVGKIGGVIAGAFAVSKISAFTIEAIKLSGEVQGVKYAFDALNKPGLLSELQKATKGTVSDLELMKSAVQANNFKIPLEQLGSLLKFAHLRAQQTGQSVDYLVQSIVLGIGRKSPLILDNLGISAIELRKRFKGVGIETATVGDIAKAVGEIATEEMRKSGEAIETTSTRIEQMRASWTNLKVTIGDILIPVVNKLVGLMDKAVSGWQNILNPGKLSKDFADQEIGRIKESLIGLKDNGEAARVLSEEMAKINFASAELQNKKFFIFGKGLKEAEQSLNAYKEIALWISNIAFKVDELNKLRTPPVLGGDTEDETAEERLARLKAEAAAYRKFIEDQMKYWYKDNWGSQYRKAVNVDDWMPGTPKQDKIRKVKPFEGSVRMTPNIEGFDESVNEIERRNEDIRKSFELTKTSVQEFSDSLISLGAQAENFEDFAKAAYNAAKQFVAAKLAEVVAQQISNAVKSSGGNPYVALAVGAAVGGATAAMFNAVVPKLAEGGIVNKPTLSMIGERGPEAVIPLKKLGQMQSKMPELALRGRDLWWMYKNENDFLNRVI